MTELNDEIINDDMYWIHYPYVLSPSGKMLDVKWIATVDSSIGTVQTLVDELNRLYRRNRHLEIMNEETG